MLQCFNPRRAATSGQLTCSLRSCCAARCAACCAAAASMPATVGFTAPPRWPLQAPPKDIQRSVSAIQAGKRWGLKRINDPELHLSEPTHQPTGSWIPLAPTLPLPSVRLRTATRGRGAAGRRLGAECAVRRQVVEACVLIMVSILVSSCLEINSQPNRPRREIARSRPAHPLRKLQ